MLSVAVASWLLRKKFGEKLRLTGWQTDANVTFSDMVVPDRHCHLAMALKATKEMCFLCFETLENDITKSTKSKVAERVIVPQDPTQCPMFVTWKLNGSLRGCIGCFDPLPLWDGLKEYAITAGMKDHRFSPISARELPQLSCAVSLLHSFEDCATPTDWEVGVHGIRLFVDVRFKVDFSECLHLAAGLGHIEIL
jgi:uncharacterized protein (TIGR00296 family)